MPSNTFSLFSLLPTELRQQIWHHSMPTTTTLHIQEIADFEVTAISSPPGQALASKEAREAYVAANFTAYGISTTEDWAESYINEETTLQLVITPPPKPTKDLHITWSALYETLFDALKAVKHLHIVCSEPERLARLWRAGEAGLVLPGESCVEGMMWDKYSVQADRDVRSSLRPDIKVSTSTSTLKESTQEVTTYELVEERTVEGYGAERTFGTTSVFRRVGEEDSQEMREWEEMVKEGGSGKGDELSEKVIAEFIKETGWKPRSSTPSSVYSPGYEMFYDGELWLTMS
jgi:hypothetical protein